MTDDKSETPGSSGIVVGGNNNSGIFNVNTGSGSITQQHAQVTADSAAAALERLDQLIALLLASAGQLPAEQAGTLAVAAVTLKNEVSAARPDQGRVRQALSRLAEAAAPVAGVIELVRQLADLVAQLLH